MRDTEKVLKQIVRRTDELSKKLPDIPYHDLHLIVRNLLKPKSWPRRFLLRKTKGGGYIF